MFANVWSTFPDTNLNKAIYRFWEAIQIKDPTEWLMQDLEMVPPAEAIFLAGYKDLARHMYLAPHRTKEPETMYVYNALIGFKCFSVPYLKLFYKDQLKIKKAGPTPTLESVLARVCCRHVLGESVPDHVLDNCVSHRGIAPAQLLATCLDASDLNEAVETADHNEAENLRDALKQMVNEKIASRSDAVSKGRRKSQKANQSVVEIDDGLIVEKAKRYLPITVPAIKVEKDEHFHKRWKFEYPRKAPLKRVSSQAFRVSSDKEALIFCLLEIWSWHEEANPHDKCPFDFSIAF